MPKVLVLFDSTDERAARLADLAAAGAKSVRFTEVDTRAVGDAESQDASRKPLRATDAVEQYDGVVVASSEHGISTAIEEVLAKVASSHGEFVDRVFAAVGDDPSTVSRLTDLGGIVVGVRAGSSDAEHSARRAGERVAKVVEWVRHSLSHEGGHGHSHHAHSHQHSH